MRNFLSGLLWIAVPLALTLGAARLWWIDFYQVPEDPNDPRNWANSPTLEPGDLLLVWRTGTPHVGSLVRCADPSDPNRWLVARIAATGGEDIELVDGQLRVNRHRVPSSACQKTARIVRDADGNEVELSCHAEELGGSKHDVAFDPQRPASHDKTVVPAGHYFLLADNRAAPWGHDSRHAEIGTLAAEACTERLVFRFWSARGWSDHERRLGVLP